jgi:hypothetical protein
MNTYKKGFNRFKELFWYSDSEPNEVLIAFCHMIALPATMIVEFHTPNRFLCLGAIIAGVFQMWAVLFNGTLKMRLIAVQVASVIAVMTIINLIQMQIIGGANVGWVIIGAFAFWNTVRVFKEKLDKGV